ncbi:single-stranded DNA-binding protein [Pseudomonas nitroreducens]|uniref:single-stranded DNA-binding protein n=1 Tax=Pseudomonas nitroreducens TaxID=46680 RepID=UPI0028A7E831|nr:single-stranded DNA-binding protein [Pseudomonas nitroreducens]
MSTPVVWEGNIGSLPEYKSFPNGNNGPRQLLRLNIMFDNSIPDGQGGYKDRGGFWCNVEWWHQDAERFASVFQKGMRVLVQGRAIMDSWKDKQTGEEVQALKVEASRVAILPHRVAQVSLLASGTGQQQQQNPRTDRQPPAPQHPTQDMRDYDGFDDDIPL